MENNVESEMKNFEFTGGYKKVSLSLAIVGLIAFGMSFAMNTTVGWVDYLVSTLFLVTISVSGLFMLSLAGIIQASWLTPYKRIPEAMTKFLPVGFVMMLVSLGGLHTIYEWTHKDIVANDPILSEKTAWLNEPRFIITLVIIFAIWIFLSAGLRKYSELMDNKENGIEAANKGVKFSVISMILFGLTMSVASWDWIMSVEPHWFSTIFGVNFFAGSFISGIAFITLVVITLKESGYFGNSITDNHLHDLAKWMFGMSVFWAYMWISQYLLIWYANIPEETEYYVLRHHNWNGVLFFNLFINFVLPFFVLMTRAAKRNTKVLKFVACVILIGHFMDLYLMIAPKVYEHHNIESVSGMGVLQLIQMVGVLGFFTFIVGSALSKRKLQPTNDPTFSEGSHLHQ